MSRRIQEEDLSDLIELVEQKVNEEDYSSMDLAAAFLKELLGESENESLKAGISSPDLTDTGAEEGMVRLFINIGRNQKVTPGNIVGAIAGESGMPGNLVGAIDVYDKYTFVDVPAEYAGEILHAMKKCKIKGRNVNVEPANQR